MNILVTGGRGYLGSVLCNKLLAKGYSVRVLDSMLYTNQTLPDNKNYELIIGDIRDMITVSKALEGIDVVVHLASIVGKEASDLDILTSIEVNSLATRNLATMCKNRKIKNLIFASTCSVYGNQPNSLLFEQSPTDPIDSYARSKLESEHAIIQEYPIATILRFGTLFGSSSRMRFDLVVNLFLAKAMNHEDITVYGGKQMRPFLHVEDASDSIIFIITNNKMGTFNVISENATLKELGNRISKEFGIDCKFKKEQKDDRNYNVSMENFNETGFHTKRNITYGISEMKDKFRNSKEIKDYKNPKYSNVNYLKLKNS